ncbi:hypothetical protein [Hoeflea sp. TYP-13]|uniref:hypothetical protein n=1 Tax=Hoeflea sp. TYP-13 TaxID=3230023 RepID=UPI0034C5C735
MKSILRGPGDIAGGLILVLYVATICAVALFFPLANWDMIAYVATILENGGHLGHELHTDAYGLVQQNVSDGQFVVLTSDRPYRIAQYEDPDAFITMLGFYRVKLLYIEFAQLLTNWTNPVEALRWVSTISAAGFGCLTLLWLGERKSLALAPLAIVALMLTGFGDAARLVTPDLFSAVFLVAGVLLYVSERGFSAGIAFLLAILARPDHLALVGVFAVVSVVVRPWSRGVVLSFIAGLAATFAISGMSAHPGWWVHMWFSNVEYVPTLEGFDPPFSVITYIQIIVKTVVRSIVEQKWLGVLLALVFLLALMLRNNFSFTRREGVAITSILVAVPAKFVVFPLYDSRFYFAYLIALCLVLIAVYGRQRQPVFFSMPPVREN